MAHDEAYYEAEKKINEALKSGVAELDFSHKSYAPNIVKLTELNESLSELTQLQSLDLTNNRLTALPRWLGNLKQLHSLNLSANRLSEIPEWLGECTQLQSLDLAGNQLSDLPISLSKLVNLKNLQLSLARSGETFLGRFYISRDAISESIRYEFKDNPLTPELAEADKQGTKGVLAYLRAKAAAQITINEAKLILVGEGEVGKTCLLGALLDEPFVEGLPTTHGIEIKSCKVTHPDTHTSITLNGWDFGGQRVYRPTHQLFFSAPAVYLVVWKPREGPQQGFVKEWIKLVKHREPSAKILVVATHGGPQQRQPDIDRQELWDLFGKETVVDFF